MLSTQLRVCFLTLLACCMVGSIYADNPDLPTIEESAKGKVDLPMSIANLGSDQFGLRRTAFMDIWRYGRQALPAIQDAKSSANLQIAEASAALETLLMLEISFGELDSEVVGLAFNPSTEQVIRLCERRNWRLAERLIASNVSLADEFRGPTGAFHANRIVETALAQADPQLAWPIIRIVTAPAISDYDGSNLAMWLAQHLDLPYTTEQDDELQALRLYYQGNASAALELDISDVLRRKIITRDGRWEVLQDPTFQTSLLGEPKSIANSAARAVLIEFSGDLRAAELAWTNILKSPDEQGQTPDDPATLWTAQQERALTLLETVSPLDGRQLFLALLLAGHISATEQYLEKTDPLAAFDFYAAGNDYPNALRLVELEPDLSNFGAWLQRRTTLIENEIAKSPDQSATFSQSAQLCSIFTSLGFRDEAESLLNTLASIAGRSKSNVGLWAGRGSIISWMGRSEQRSLCLDIVEKRISFLATETQHAILSSLFPEFLYSSMVLSQTAPRLQSPDGSLLSPLRAMDHLHAWDRNFFSESSQTTSLSDWLGRAHRELLAKQAAIKQPAMLAAQLAELAEVALGCGMPDLALEFADVDLRDLGGADVASKPHWIVAAKIYLERGDGKKAAELLTSVRNEKTSANDQVALSSEIKALLLAGDYDQAVLLERTRWLRPLALTQFYQGLAYSQVADSFVKQGEFSYAKEYAELTFELSDYSSMDTYWAAAELSQIHEELDDFASSADTLRTPLVEALQPNSGITSFLFDRGAYSSLRYAAQKERIHRAAACIDRGNLQEAQHHIAVGERLQPQDIEMIVQCYPRLVKAGQQDLADKLFHSYETNMLRQIETWNKDSTALNNLAWMYAQCDRKLAEAYELSKKAVELAPTSATFLDTLAEVHYRSGRVSEALQVMQRCVQLDPRERHYSENLVRFQQGEP